MTQEALDVLRTRIDELDEQIVVLVARRFATTDAIGAIKLRTGLPATDPARKNHRSEWLQTLAHRHGLDPVLVARMYDGISREVVDSHRRMGAPG